MKNLIFGIVLGAILSTFAFSHAGDEELNRSLYEMRKGREANDQLLEQRRTNDLLEQQNQILKSKPC